MATRNGANSGRAAAKARTTGCLRSFVPVSPLAVPVLLEVGREAIYGEAIEDALADAAQAEALIADAMIDDENDDSQAEFF